MPNGLASFDRTDTGLECARIPCRLLSTTRWLHLSMKRSSTSSSKKSGKSLGVGCTSKGRYCPTSSSSPYFPHTCLFDATRYEALAKAPLIILATLCILKAPLVILATLCILKAPLVILATLCILLLNPYHDSRQFFAHSIEGR